MYGRCEQCGERVEMKASGPSARYCSARCRQRAYRARCKKQLPARMRELPRWTAAAGKRPVTTDGAPASSTDAQTWTSHEEVVGGPHGVMLGGGLACIDLDHCLSARGKLAPWAREIIDAVPGAVVERSVSKRGIHIFGLLPEAPGRRRGRAEVYSRARFIRTTEDIYRVGKIIDLQPAVTKLNSLERRGEIPT
ncbi:hypothetical protein PBI_COLLEEN_1 [Corynebacterium phage Colleen]|nr:hypothetical protein PBI_TOUCHMENOT_1 [Corynebacterium phage TouchMeNot]QFG14750.1 hypothetical protein PBI_COLLEEN_1 [Corynebacterium phage Colleen]UVT31887.1 DNA binding protein [Corynebacterium phage Arianna]